MNKPRLTAVPTAELPAPPYPDTTKAGSFAFDIEVDRLIASDTWALLPADVRPWAMMTWVMSWQQFPCGSWPANDDVIAARIGCDRRWFELHKDEIMRGWKLHADNRLYHSVITQKVLSFLDTRNKWKNKWDKKKQRLSSELSGESPRTPVDSPPSSSSSSSSSSSEEEVVTNVTTRRQNPNCPHEEIIDAYHRILPTCTAVRVWNARRQALLRSLWKQHPDLAWFEGYFQYVSESKFLTGQASPQPGRKPFVADLEWLCRDSNFTKVYEGKYHGK